MDSTITEPGTPQGINRLFCNAMRCPGQFNRIIKGGPLRFVNISLFVINGQSFQQIIDPLAVPVFFFQDGTESRPVVGLSIVAVVDGGYNNGYHFP